jgi:hypothetical protein
MVKTLRRIRTVKKSWDSDNALKSTYKGIIGKYQLRLYIFLALGYGIVAAWLTEMPAFARKNFKIKSIVFELCVFLWNIQYYLRNILIVHRIIRIFPI